MMTQSNYVTSQAISGEEKLLAAVPGTALTIHRERLMGGQFKILCHKRDA
jgi:hypothetical protein